MKLIGKRKRRPYRPTSKVLMEVALAYENEVLTVDEIKASLHRLGFGILLAIFSLPLILPIPMPPGYTTIFAIPLFILAFQMMVLKESPWLPRWITKKRISRNRVQGIVAKSVPVLRWIETIVKPRYWPEDDRMIERSIGMFTFLFALSIAVPLPMTNVPPGFGVLLMALGLLARDGVAVLIGKIIGLLGCALTLTILIVGPKVIMKFISG